ncbi:MAG: alpha/beta-hydrolase family protein [Dehalococcoidia bacterium]
MRIPRLRRPLPRTDQAGAFLAAAGVPLTFQRTLMPRNTVDQGIVTGVSTALTYLLAAVAHDAIEVVAARLAGPPANHDAHDTSVRRTALGLHIAAAVCGLALQRTVPERRYEPLTRSALRTAGHWIAGSAASAAAVSATEEVLHTLDRRGRVDLGLRHLPATLVAGGVMAAISEYGRHRRAVRDQHRTDGPIADVPGVHMSVLRALALGGGVTLGLFAFADANRLAAREIGRMLTTLLPGDVRLWQLAARIIELGLLGVAVATIYRRANRRIEAGMRKIEPAVSDPPAVPWVSGGAGSLVPWDTLGREGRRHVATYMHHTWIEEVMQEPATNPIRAYVGLDSAPTETDRVALAIAELHRTGAFDRDLLIAVSPTGTGYVNYVAIESAEYMTRGNCATVTIQYSKRPSSMSIDRVWEGRKHFRLLVVAIHEEVRQRPPEKRPRFVVFGESLGAQTSQDAFLHEGTRGLTDAGVERGLWIGSPHLSKWKVEVFGPPRPDVEPTLVATFDNFGQLEAMDPEARARLRYFLITHGNDAVGYFGADLLIQRPDWLGPPDTRPPRVPLDEQWQSPTTFVQTLIDMKNAMHVIPGDFAASGHDYRADLARFVREAYALQCSDEQLARIETALRRFEKAWQDQLDAKEAGGEIASPFPDEHTGAAGAAVEAEASSAS